MMAVNGFFDQRAGDYRARSNSFPWKRIRDFELNAVSSHVVAEDPKILMDIGCGAGFYMEAFRSKIPGLMILGCDISSKMCEAAKKEGLLVENKPFQNFEPSHKACCVLAAGLLEFVEAPEDFFHKALGWLKPTGSLVLLVPNNNLWGMIYRRHHQWAGNRVYMRGPEVYLRLAKEKGFYPIRTSRVFPFAIVITFRLEEK